MSDGAGSARVAEWLGERAAFLELDSAEETFATGRGLALPLAPDGVLLLEGEMGAGKTVLVQGLAAALGIDPTTVVSPTFTLVHEHGNPGGATNGEPTLVHIDLYRLDASEAGEIGLDEVLQGPGIKAIEWAERLPDWLRASVTRDEERPWLLVRVLALSATARRLEWTSDPLAAFPGSC